MHLCVYSLFTFLFLPLALISIPPNANAYPLSSWSNFEESAFLEFVKGKEYFEQWELDYEAKKFKSILGTFYLLVQNWNCENILEQIQGDDDRKKCQEYRKYLNFAHEYLFRVFIKAADPKLSEQMPAVAPRFQHTYSKENNFKLAIYWLETTLMNEEALNKVDEIIQMHQLKPNEQEIAKILAEINEALKSDKFFANFNDVPELLVPEDIVQQFAGNSKTKIREQFHEFLKQMYKETQLFPKERSRAPGLRQLISRAEEMAKLVIDPNSKGPLA
uniref:RGS domain-containing protein n=1 Tax=Globodera pallida TaxID=36090 RepID=A0A183BN28_GLOPA